MQGRRLFTSHTLSSSRECGKRRDDGPCCSCEANILLMPRRIKFCLQDTRRHRDGARDGRGRNDRITGIYGRGYGRRWISIVWIHSVTRSANGNGEKESGRRHIEIRRSKLIAKQLDWCITGAIQDGFLWKTSYVFIWKGYNNTKLQIVFLLIKLGFNVCALAGTVIVSIGDYGIRSISIGYHCTELKALEVTVVGSWRRMIQSI